MADEGTPAGGPEHRPVSDRILTVPNALSALRLAGVPLFLWLLVSGYDGWALIALALSALTDYLDGKIARAFGQITRLGQLLDPVADRLYIIATLVGLAWRSVIPWWVLALIVGRDVLLAILMAALKRAGQTGLPVNVVGKAATFSLLYAFPVLLAATLSDPLAAVLRPIGWGFAWWGIYLYWVAAVLYTVQGARILRARTSPVEASPIPRGRS